MMPDSDERTASISENGITRQWESAKLKKTEKFILLEDVTFSFKHPCVLDLKMGTRCFGDGSTKAKYERKKKRALESTSATLGVRLCGMMVYQSDKGAYSFTDKYQGRRFNNDEFFYAIKSFFFNGTKYRAELLTPLITQLAVLLEQVEKIECYRFYCSSLLLLYDGHEVEGIVPRIDVKMIDFAQTRVKEEPTNHHVGPDRGYILGIKTLIKISDEIKASI